MRYHRSRVAVGLHGEKKKRGEQKRVIHTYILGERIKKRLFSGPLISRDILEIFADVLREIRPIFCPPPLHSDLASLFRRR